jgi:hypothetical protein
MRQNVLRPLAQAAAALFFISLAFPAVAAFIKDTASWPKWWGTIDVTLALVLVVLVMVIQTAARTHVDRQVKETTYKLYRVLLNGVLLVLAIFFLAGDRIIWTQCLTGFAWRYWLLLYSLPWWVALNTGCGEPRAPAQ